MQVGPRQSPCGIARAAPAKELLTKLASCRRSRNPKSFRSKARPHQLRKKDKHTEGRPDQARPPIERGHGVVSAYCAENAQGKLYSEGGQSANDYDSVNRSKCHSFYCSLGSNCIRNGLKCRTHTPSWTYYRQSGHWALLERANCSSECGIIGVGKGCTDRPLHFFFASEASP
jgi:hypothetical protein